MQRGGFLKRRFLSANNDDMRPFLRKALRDRPADAGASACYKRHFVLQFHAYVASSLSELPRSTRMRPG